MRPLQLTMQAFGPYAKRTTLDFTCLGAQNIFVITGPTGGGKTTIFDAMCYALYGKTTGERSEKGLRSDFVQDEDNLVTEVIFRFEVRGSIYEIRRQPAQKLHKLRGSGYKDGEHEAELRCINEESSQDAFAPLSRLNEVEKKIEEILGLNYDQFRKIVMIPQGEFRRFLSASTTEKQEILQKLFGTQIYEQVQNQLAVQAKELENSYKELKTYLQTQLKQIQPGDNAVLAQLVSGSAGYDTVPQILELLAEHTETALHRIDTLLMKHHRDTAQQKRLQQELETAGRMQEKWNQLQKLKAEQKTLSEQAEQIEAKELQLTHALKAQPLEVIAQACNAQEHTIRQLERTIQTDTVALSAMQQNMQILTRRLEAAEVIARQQQQIVEKEAERDLLLKQYQEIKAYSKLYNSILQDEKQVWQSAQQVAEQEETIRQLRRQQILHLGASLAANLSEGAPCPVCGSVHHPALNRHEGEGIADHVIMSAEQELQTLRDTYQNRASILAKQQGQLSQAAAVLIPQLPGIETETNGLIKAEVLTSYAKQITEAGKTIRNELDQLKAAQLQQMQILGWRSLPEDWQVQFEQIQKQGSDTKLAYSAKEGALIANQEQLKQHQMQLDRLTQEWQNQWQQYFASEEAYRSARLQIENIPALQQQCTAYKAQVSSNIEAIAAYEAELEHQKPIDQQALQQQLDALTDAIAASVRQQERLKQEHAQNQRVYEECRAVLTSITQLMEKHTLVKRLSDVARGNNEWKMSFEIYVLVTYFLQVLEMANQRLLKMTGGRYYFLRHAEAGDKRKAAGLDLDIMDNYTGRARSVNSLSGGEGFKASLALALGLSDTVQHTAGGIELNTIFIDEGFGTLDSDSLESTIACLLELQQHGRLVGVISHVAELKEQIPAWLVVDATERGSSAEFVIKE